MLYKLPIFYYQIKYVNIKGSAIYKEKYIDDFKRLKPK